MISSFSKDYEVCNCKKVSLEKIILAIKENNAKTLGDIQNLTRAGTECRYCIVLEADFGKVKKRIYCKDILDEVKKGATLDG